MKKLLLPAGIWAIFETVAVSLWLTKDNLFYLLNFSYIGAAVALGIFLYTQGYEYARRVTQLLVGCYMLVYLGLICGENMQIEGFWYYLFTGVFEAATIHYVVAKIFGPLFFGRGWCGYACWTAMVLDLLPYKQPNKGLKRPEALDCLDRSRVPDRLGRSRASDCLDRCKAPDRLDRGRALDCLDRSKESDRFVRPDRPRKNLGRIRYVTFALSLTFVAALFLAHVDNIERVLFWAFLIGNLLYYIVGIALAFHFQDNRAFCKYVCPVTVFLKPMSYFAVLRIKCDKRKCISCGKCRQVCPMGVDMTDNSRRRENGTECILCLECVKSCPKKAL